MKQTGRIFENIFRKLAGIFSVATVLECHKGHCKLKFSDDDIQEDILITSPYGFHSIPLDGSRAIVLNSGDRTESIIIAGNSKKLFKDSEDTPGVVQLIEEGGASITLKGGNISFKAKTMTMGASQQCLLELNKELLGILKEMTTPGAVAVAGSLGQFSPLILTKLTALETKWG